jgi:hypothetical protein
MGYEWHLTECVHDTWQGLRRERILMLCQNRKLSMVVSTPIALCNRGNASNVPILYRRGLSISSLHV